MLGIRKLSLRIIPALFLFIILCSIGATRTPVNTNNADSNCAVTLDDEIFWHIDRDGYLIFNITNMYEFDLYNISCDIEFWGGILIFKVNSETDAFVDHHASGETITVKSNDPVIEPWSIVGRPMYFGTYMLTIDITIDGTYYGQAWCSSCGIFRFLFHGPAGFIPGDL